MNETIKGWIGGIKNPLLRLFLGVLISAIIALWIAREYDNHQRIAGLKKALENKDKVIESQSRLLAGKDSALSKCADEKFQIVYKQNERLEDRQDRQQTATKILKSTQ